MMSSNTYNHTGNHLKYPNVYPHTSTSTQNLYQAHTPTYNQNPASQPQLENNHIGVTDLTQSFGSINLGAANNAGSIRLKENTLPPGMLGYNGVYGAQNGSQFFHMLPDGSLVLSNMCSAPAAYQQYPTYSAQTSQTNHLQQVGYSGLPAPITTGIPNTPSGQAWASSQQVPREIPGLLQPRRNSWSSNEENGPRTPIFPVSNQVGYQPAIVLNRNSPSIWSTPSPQHASSQPWWEIGKSANGKMVEMDFPSICSKEPAIPRAIPALFSKRDTIDKIFDNPHSTTNVYIRGLWPKTTDAMLEQYGTRFGRVESAKSIIEYPTGLCKGFGFLQYFNFVDAENCIRGFFFCGYEAKFAKPSQNSRLKTLSRPDNTNLYVSNLPQAFNEAQLSAVFHTVSSEFKVLSQKILRDSLGVSRGVGFARFETPEICEKVIKQCHGLAVGEGQDTTIMQLRYADTQDQKQLKQQTADRRRFKTHEYNVAVSDPESPCRLESPLAAVFPSPIQARGPGLNNPWINPSPVSSASAEYYYLPQQSVTSEAQNLPVPVNNSIVSSRHSSRVKIEFPKDSSLATSKLAENSDSNIAETASDAESNDERSSAKAKPGSSSLGLSPKNPKL